MVFFWWFAMEMMLWLSHFDDFNDCDDVPEVAPACLDMMSKLVQLEAGEGAEVQMENQFSLSHRFEQISMTSFLFDWLILTKKNFAMADRNYIIPQGPPRGRVLDHFP